MRKNNVGQDRGRFSVEKHYFLSLLKKMHPSSGGFLDRILTPQIDSNPSGKGGLEIAL